MAVIDLEKEIREHIDGIIEEIEEYTGGLLKKTTLYVIEVGFNIFSLIVEPVIRKITEE